MADLATASMTPWNITIDTSTYKVQKLTLKDLAGIAEMLLRQARDAILHDDTIKDEKERINKSNGLQSMGIFEVMDWCLTTIEGMVMTMYLSLIKAQPDLSYEVVSAFGFNDNIVQLVYDILGIKRRAVSSDDTKKKDEASPFPLIG